MVEGEPAWQHLVAELDEFLPAPTRTLSAAAAELISDLTARELEVLELIAQGHDNRTISKTLGISERTARNHASGVFSKLGVGSRAQAIVLAREAGLGRDIER